MADTEFQDPLAIDPLAVVSQVNPPDPPAGTSFMPPAPQTPEQPQPAGRGRPKGTKVTPLQRAMPNPERVKVGRRTKDGHLAHIGYFRWADLERLGSVEAFLKDYVVPAHSQPGVNEYELHYVRPDGSEQPAGMVVIEVPAGAVPGFVPDPLQQVQQVVRLTRDLQAEAQRAAPPAPPPPDPIEQLKNLLALQKQMGQGNDGGGLLMMMMMQMMQQQREPPRGPEPLELAMRIIEQTRPPPLPPPMPMPPPGPDPIMLMMIEQQKMQMQMQIEGMKMQAEQQKSMLEAMRHQDRGPGIAEIFQLSQSMIPKDTLGARDILPMVSTIKDIVRPPERDHLKDTLEAVQLLKRAVKDMSDDGKPSAWRDLQEGLLPKGVDSITEMIQAIRQKEQHQAMAGPPQQPPPQPPSFPPGFEEYAQAINAAKTGAQAIEAALGAFFFLGQHVPQFRPSLETLIHHVRGSDREAALDFLQKFLEGLGESGAITQDAANRTMQAFDEHWDVVVKHIMGGPPDGNAKPKQPIAPDPPPEHKLKSPPTVQ